MTEIWRPVSGSRFYEVSNIGRVKSLSRVVRCGNRGDGVRTIPERILTASIFSKTGYPYVQLEDRRNTSVHRLVAMAFCPGHAPGLVVNHKNGNRIDNRAENLEWVTHGENIKHSFRELGRVSHYTGVRSAAHPTSKAIIARNIHTGEERRFDCALDAVRSIPGLDSGGISRCCYGEAKWHKGYTFQFAGAA
jgi:hypothetical protein